MGKEKFILDEKNHFATVGSFSDGKAPNSDEKITISNGEYPAPTRTTGTVKKYEKRAKNILQRIQEFSPSDPILILPEWLASKRQSIRRASFRQYKAALLCYLENIPNPGDKVKGVIQQLREMTSFGCLRSSDKTSAGKRKFIREKEFLELIYLLRERNTRQANITADWVAATTATGLRPSEWSDIEWRIENGQVDLIVSNRKATNGRGTGPTRSISIPIDENLIDEGGYPVARLLQTLSDWYDKGKNYDQFIQMVKRQLESAANTTGVRISPYTLRHQFAANAKNIMPTKEVAELMAHKNSKTTTFAYRGKESGWKKFKQQSKDEE